MTPGNLSLVNAEDLLVEEYRELLEEVGIAIPTQVTRDLDLDRLCLAGSPDVRNAARHGIFVLESRSCRVCGQPASSGADEVLCGRCPARVPPSVKLILPPVTSVLAAVRDEALRLGWNPFALLLEGLARRAGYQIGSNAILDTKWTTGRWWGEEHPMEGFTHIVRSPLDPEQENRARRKAKYGRDASVEWKKLKGGDVTLWKKRILEVLGGAGEPVTFNAIMLVATGGVHTADVAHGNDPDKALWALVEEKKIQHTGEAPILFRLVRKRTG